MPADRDDARSPTGRASPSMHVISLWMTAVFTKPPSKTRKPSVVSFSPGSPGFFGAAMDLNAVADIVLLRIPNTTFQRGLPLRCSHPGAPFLVPATLSLALPFWTPRSPRVSDAAGPDSDSPPDVRGVNSATATDWAFRGLIQHPRDTGCLVPAARSSRHNLSQHGCSRTPQHSLIVPP